MQNEMGEKNRRGESYTYDRARNPTKGANYNDKGRNGRIGTFRRRNNRNCRRGGWWLIAPNGRKIDDGGGPNRDWDTSYYHRDLPLSHVNFNGGNSSPSELEFGDIDNWKADIEIENYLVNSSFANDYMGTVRSGDFDVSETPAKTNLSRRNRTGKKGRTIIRHGSNFWETYWGYRSFRPRRFPDQNRRNVSDGGNAIIDRNWI